MCEKVVGDERRWTRSRGLRRALRRLWGLVRKMEADLWWLKWLKWLTELEGRWGLIGKKDAIRGAGRWNWDTNWTGQSACAIMYAGNREPTNILALFLKQVNFNLFLRFLRHMLSVDKSSNWGRGRRRTLGLLRLTFMGVISCRFGFNWPKFTNCPVSVVFLRGFSQFTFRRLAVLLVGCAGAGEGYCRSCWPIERSNWWWKVLKQHGELLNPRSYFLSFSPILVVDATVNLLNYDGARLPRSLQHHQSFFCYDNSMIHWGMDPIRNDWWPDATASIEPDHSTHVSSLMGKRKIFHAPGF